MSKNKFNYDYSKTLWMKMFLARPDFENNKSEVLITFEQALDIIKMIDNITQGIQKIIYMVGWQGLGHDDCFPEMELVNPYLKRECDPDARSSFLWLYEEAKKYNTVVSVHGNVADEYEANKSHGEFVAADAILKNPDGTPAIIEWFNGRGACKTSYKQYWESGLFKKYWERFCDTIPVKEAGTVHLDNFAIAENLNPRTTCEEQDEARNKILDYIMSLGIDVTSEYTYRECPLRADSHSAPIREYYKKGIDEEQLKVRGGYSPIRALGRIPAVWWLGSMSIDDHIEIDPALYSGHIGGSAPALRNVFYGTMHGEDIWMNHGIEKDVWVPLFIKAFCTEQIPYVYLNRYKRLSYTGTYEDGFCVAFSEGVESCGNEKSICKNGVVVKKGNDVILPLNEENKKFIAYSENGREGDWNMPDADFNKAMVYNITADGNEFIEEVTVTDKKISLNLKAGQAVVIIAE